MVHGLLLDPYREFFVSESAIIPNNNTPNNANPPNNPTPPAPTSTLSTTTDQFSLRFNMIPGYASALNGCVQNLLLNVYRYIPFRVCEKILFIGWAVRVLQQQLKPTNPKSSITSSSSSTSLASKLLLQRTNSTRKFTRTKARGLSTSMQLFAFFSQHKRLFVFVKWG